MLRQLRLVIALATVVLGADPQSILAQPSRPGPGQRVRVNLAAPDRWGDAQSVAWGGRRSRPAQLALEFSLAR